MIVDTAADNLVVGEEGKLLDTAAAADILAEEEGPNRLLHKSIIDFLQ